MERSHSPCLSGSFPFFLYIHLFPNHLSFPHPFLIFSLTHTFNISLFVHPCTHPVFLSTNALSLSLSLSLFPSLSLSLSLSFTLSLAYSSLLSSCTLTVLFISPFLLSPLNTSSLSPLTPQSFLR